LKTVDANQDISELIEETKKTSKPIRIKSKKGSAILISSAYFKAIQETLYLSSMPEVKKAIIDGMCTSVEECEELDWKDIK